MINAFLTLLICPCGVTKKISNKQTSKKFSACRLNCFFFSFNNEYYIDFQKKPTLMGNQFLPGKPRLSNRQKAVLGNTCFPFFYSLFLIHFTQIKEQTEARELAEDT